MEWLKNDNWKMKHNKKEIYLMVNHKWAFVVWEFAKIDNIINENSLLIHVDSHLDDVPEIARDERYFSARKKEDILSLANYIRTEEDDENFSLNYELRMDNFIFPSFLRHTIQDIIYVCDQDLEEISIEDINNAANNLNVETQDKSGDIGDFIKCYEQINGHEKTIQRFFSVEEYLDEVKSLPKEQTKILDLDLDYFNDSNNVFEPNLKSDDTIKSNLKELKEQCEWDIITVALSPRYCGGDENCLHILELFLEVFELDPSDFNAW